MQQEDAISPRILEFVKPNGEKFGDLDGSLISFGRTGVIFRQSDRILKYPRTEDLDTIPAEEHRVSKYLAQCYLDRLRTEIMIYKRLGRHEGIIEYFGANEHDSFELAFAKQGDLQSYMHAHPDKAVDTALKTRWILSMVDTLTYIHSRRVLVDDIAMRNFLIDDNYRLLFCDFGGSSILPLDSDMETAVADGMTAKIDILHLGWAIYSVSLWEVRNYNYFFDDFMEEVWPVPAEFATVDDVFCGDIIKKYWGGQYRNMEEVKAEVHALLDE